MTTRKMIINALDPDEVRIATLKGRVLDGFDIETRSVEKNKGNIYLGIVMAVEPSLNAAFVHYGPEKQGFLTANDIHPKYFQNDDGQDRPRITSMLKPKQRILVQVSKDEVGTKGAVLTTYLSLAGRYVVLMPDSDTQGVSRKIEDEETRQKAREAASMLDVPQNMGVIIRTAGQDRTKQELNRDLQFLLRLWENIQKEASTAKAPALIFKEQDVIIRALRDYFQSDTDEIVLDSDEAYDRAEEYMRMVMPQQRSALTRYVERRPIFHHYGIEEQLETIYTPKVSLQSGGSLVIQPTEALVSIDVNSGKQKSQDQEDTALQVNLDAAAEIARQLRLRDLGGIIVIDFIDMFSRRNQQRVEKALKEALSSDKARVKVGRISPNGTLELTRQRIRSALQASMFDTCAVCNGTGHVLHPRSHAMAVLRKLRDRASRGDLKRAKVQVPAHTANLLRTDMWATLEELEKRFNIHIDVVSEPSFTAQQNDFTFETDPHAVVLPLSEPDFGPAPRLDDTPSEPSSHTHASLSGEDFTENAMGEERRHSRHGSRRRSYDMQSGRDLTRDVAEDWHFDMPRFEFVEMDRPSSNAATQQPQNDRSASPRSDVRSSNSRPQHTRSNTRTHSGQSTRSQQERHTHHDRRGGQHSGQKRHSSNTHARPATQSRTPSSAATQPRKQGLLGRLLDLFKL